MSTKAMISIWFFVGCLLTIYGALILTAGLHESPADTTNVAMQGLHLQRWWGIGMIAMGSGYIVRFRPRRLK